MWHKNFTGVLGYKQSPNTNYQTRPSDSKPKIKKGEPVEYTLPPRQKKNSENQRKRKDRLMELARELEGCMEYERDCFVNHKTNAHGTVHEGLVRRLKDESRPSKLQVCCGRPEHWEDSRRWEENCFHWKSTESLSANDGVKNSQGIQLLLLNILLLLQLIIIIITIKTMIIINMIIHSNSSERPSVDAKVKNSQGVINKNKTISKAFRCYT